jgi:hypothetical protein
LEVLGTEDQEVNMPWDNKTIIIQRRLMLQELFQEKALVTKIAREFGVSCKIFHKFKHRFEVGGSPV